MRKMLAVIIVAFLVVVMGTGAAYFLIDKAHAQALKQEMCADALRREGSEAKWRLVEHYCNESVETWLEVATGEPLPPSLVERLRGLGD